MKETIKEQLDLFEFTASEREHRQGHPEHRAEL
jgi:hypothetical protein